MNNLFISMAVRKTDNEKALTLELDNGDKERFNQVLKDWHFKDEESMVRFVLSILLDSDDKKTIAYKKNNILVEATPTAHILTK